MRFIFAGTPEFAAGPLAALIAAGHRPCAVYTQPDRPAGRGRKLTPSPVKQLALEHDIDVHQPQSLRDEAAQDALRQLEPELMVVIAYGLILPQAVLDVPRMGCVNLHASLLPRWRGAAPIQRAILAGDEQTGVCLMQMDAGLDTGPELARAACPIGPAMTAGELHDELMRIGAEALPGWFEALAAGRLAPTPQPEAGATYAHKLDRAEAALDWTRPAIELARAVRAYNPWPVAHTTLDGENLRIWRARPSDLVTGAPGIIGAPTAEGLPVACGDGSLIVEELQFAGGRRLPAADAARGRALTGKTLGDGDGH